MVLIKVHSLHTSQDGQIQYPSPNDQLMVSKRPAENISDIFPKMVLNQIYGKLKQDDRYSGILTAKDGDQFLVNVVADNSGNLNWEFTIPENRVGSDLFNKIPDPAAVCDRQGLIIHCNEAFNRDIRNQSAGQIFFDYLPDPAHQSRIKEFLHSTDPAGSSFEVNVREGNDHHVVSYYVRIRRIQPGLFILTLINLAPFKQIQLELQNNEKKTRILLETAAQGILLTNLYGSITLVNHKIEQQFGYSREELLEKPVEILIPEALRYAHERHRQRFVESPKARELGKGLEITGRRKDGSIFPIEVSLSAVNLLDGLSILTFVTDITERKKLETRILQMEKLEAIGQLAGGIAHDFNNVLAGIIGMSELGLRNLKDGDSPEEYLKMIINKANGAAGLVRKLLTFSRQQVLTIRELNLSRIVQENQELLQRYLGESIELSATVETDLPYIKADPTAIDQIITNLCINARDAMPDGGKLVIETASHPLPLALAAKNEVSTGLPYVRLSVIDYGIGMNDEIAGHMFEPFFTTKDIGQGTGLGLSIVYGLVKQHEGLIEVESRIGEGTRIDVYFPVCNQRSHPAGEEKEMPLPGGRETLLVVEDEPDLLNSYQDLLNGLGYKVISAADGLKALQILQEEIHSIEMIISDVVMPKMGGLELKLIAGQMRPGIPFLLISGFADKVEPGHPFLQKPFRLESLAVKIRQMLEY